MTCVMTQQDLKKYLDGLARKGQQLSPQLIKVRSIYFVKLSTDASNTMT